MSCGYCFATRARSSVSELLYHSVYPHTDWWTKESSTYGSGRYSLFLEKLGVYEGYQYSYTNIGAEEQYCHYYI